MIKKIIKFYWTHLKYKYHFAIEGGRLGVSWHQILLIGLEKFNLFYVIARIKASEYKIKEGESIHLPYVTNRVYELRPYCYEYWHLVLVPGITHIVEMPEKHVKEMVASWRANQLANGIKDPNELANFYFKFFNRPLDAFHPKTREMVERYVNAFYGKYKD